MLYLPEDRDSERQIFSEALAGYLASTEEEVSRSRTLGTLVVRFWEKLPPAVILEAADRILDHTKAEAGAGHSPFNFAPSHGLASFDSVYELRLFQLLPVIQDLDPSRAQQLLRENPKTKSVLEQYLQGMRSLDSRFTSAPRHQRGSSDIFTISRGPISYPEEYKQQAEIEKQRKAIYELARKDAKRALESTLAMPGNVETRATLWSQSGKSWASEILQSQKRPSRKPSNCLQSSNRCSGFKFSSRQRMFTCN